MITLLVLSVIIACVVGLVCIFGGRMLKGVNLPPAAALGGFLEQFAWAIGLLAGVWYFVSNGGIPA